jgi:hypothetical protein
MQTETVSVVHLDAVFVSHQPNVLHVSKGIMHWATAAGPVRRGAKCVRLQVEWGIRVVAV